MGRFWFGGLLIAVGFWLVISTVVKGYPAEDLVVSLPGQPKVEFRQFAGYVDVDIKAGRSLFYYFAEAEHHSHDKPLTLWLNGGPGCSSVGGGAFTELGPFFPTGDGRGLRRNSMSWNRASNLLFVESPAGVGWSYSNTTSDYNSGDASTARDMYVFLLKWYEKFPEFKSRELFLTGESYAGHYIPQLADVLLDHNVHSTGFKFNIKGVAIGNPLLKLDRDIPATYEFFWSHGMISDELGLKIMNECDFDDYTFSSPHNVSHSCSHLIKEANLIVGDYIDNYDVILDVCYPSIVEQELRLRKMATKISLGVDVCLSFERRFYFNIPEVQEALHANRTKLPYNWSMCSGHCYFQTGSSLKLGMTISSAFRVALRTWASWVDASINTNRTTVFFRTFESSHWSGPNRNSCKVTRHPSSKPGGREHSVISDTILDVVKSMKAGVKVLHVTPMGAFRSDAHVGTWSDKPKVPDCSHWCLPGVPDMWNEFLFSHLLSNYALHLSST